MNAQEELLHDVHRNQPWALPEEALLVGYLFAKRHFESLQRVFARSGANEREANALFALADSGPLSQRELRKIMVIAPGTISDLMRALEKSGLVAAESSAADRREKLWSITAEGRRVLDTSMEQIYALLPELFRGFTRDRQESFLESLRLLQRNAQRVKQTLEMEP